MVELLLATPARKAGAGLIHFTIILRRPARQRRRRSFRKTKGCHARCIWRQRVARPGHRCRAWRSRPARWGWPEIDTGAVNRPAGITAREESLGTTSLGEEQ